MELSRSRYRVGQGLLLIPPPARRPPPQPPFLYHVSMRPRKIAVFSLALASVSALAAGLSAMNDAETGASLAGVMIDRFLVILAFGAFGLMASYESQLRGSLIVTEDEWSITIRDAINFGVLPGLVLGLINYLFFSPTGIALSSLPVFERWGAFMMLSSSLWTAG